MTIIASVAFSITSNHLWVTMNVRMTLMGWRACMRVLPRLPDSGGCCASCLAVKRLDDWFSHHRDTCARARGGLGCYDSLRCGCAQRFLPRCDLSPMPTPGIPRAEGCAYRLSADTVHRVLQERAVGPRLMTGARLACSRRNRGICRRCLGCSCTAWNWRGSSKQQRG